MFEARTTAELRLLAPHLRFALKVHWSLHKERADATLRETALNAMPTATMWLSPTGQILFANAAAHRMLDSGNFLRSRNGHLLAWGARAGQPLRDALAQACGGTAVTVALDIRGRFVARFLPPQPYETGHKTVFGVLLQIESADTACDHGAIDSLARLYKLTPSERDALKQLAEGRTAREIADLGRVAISTVRTHLQSLFRKTGSRRQVDLMRLVMAYAPRTT